MKLYLAFWKARVDSSSYWFLKYSYIPKSVCLPIWSRDLQSGIHSITPHPGSVATTLLGNTNRSSPASWKMFLNRQMIWRASTSCLQSSYFKDGDLPDDPASYVFAQLHALGVSLTTQTLPLQLTDPTTLHLKLSQVRGLGSTLYGCSRLIVNIQYNGLWVTGQVAALLDLVRQSFEICPLPLISRW